MNRRLAACLLALLVASCGHSPQVVSLNSVPRGERFDHALHATQLLFPDLRVRHSESGWIVSLPRYVGGRDRRRLQAYVRVVDVRGEPPRVEYWVERQVFGTKWLFGLLGSEGWKADGRDADFEARLRRRLDPRLN